MKKKERLFIKNRKNLLPTPYYQAGKILNIGGIVVLPDRINKVDKKGRVECCFKLGALTANFVYYLHQEADAEDTLLLNRDLQLVSDNYFAFNDLCELVGNNASLLWISNAVKVWQREQYIRPHLLTPELIKALHKVDIDRLSEPQKELFTAFHTNGPVTYTKAESLMAVLSNDLCTKSSTDPLTPILEQIIKNTPGAF